MRSVLAHIMLMHGRCISECIFAGPFLSQQSPRNQPEIARQELPSSLSTETREWHSYATIRDIPSQDNGGKRELTSKCESEKRVAAYASVEGADSHVHSESDPEQ